MPGNINILWNDRWKIESKEITESLFQMPDLNAELIFHACI